MAILPLTEEEFLDLDREIEYPFLLRCIFLFRLFMNLDFRRTL